MRLFGSLILLSLNAACSSTSPGQASVVGMSEPVDVTSDPSATAAADPGAGVAVEPDVALAVANTALDQARYYVRRNSNGAVETVWLMLSNLRHNPCSVSCEDTAGEPEGTIAKLNLGLSSAPSVGMRSLTASEARTTSFILTQPGCDDEGGTPAEAALLGHRTMNALGGEIELRDVDLASTLSGSIELLLPVGSLAGEFEATHCSELDIVVPANPPGS